MPIAHKGFTLYRDRIYRVHNKFTRVCEAYVLFPIFIEIWLAVGRFAVGCFGSNEAANRQLANQISMKIELETKNLHFRANLLYTQSIRFFLLTKTMNLNSLIKKIADNIFDYCANSMRILKNTLLAYLACPSLLTTSLKVENSLRNQNTSTLYINSMRYQTTD
jgi:hypothetical protein